MAAASLAAHAKGLTAPPLDYHSHRQVNTAAIARNFHRHGDFLKPRIDWEGNYQGRAATEFPLYMWLVGLLWPLGGLGELWGRILSALFSALTAVFLFLFLDREMESEAALYGGLLFSCLPLEIYFGRTIQPEALALLGTMASLYYWDSFLRQGGGGRWLLAVLCAFLAVSLKLPYAYGLLPLAGLAFIRQGKGAARRPALWLAGAAVALGVWAWYRYAGSGVYVVPSHRGEILTILEYGRLPFFLWFQFSSRFPELCATYGGLILLIMGARELILRRGRAFYAIWLAALALYVTIGGGYVFYHEYALLPFTLVNAALMGAGLYQLRLRAAAGRRPWAMAGLSLLALSVPVHAGLRIRHWYRQDHAFLAKASQAADRVSSPEDLFLCNQRAPSLYLYYLDRRGWSWDLAEAGPAEMRRVEEKIQEGAKFFMTRKDGLFKDREGFFARWFYSRYPAVYDQDGILIFRLAGKAQPGKKPSKG